MNFIFQNRRLIKKLELRLKSNCLKKVTQFKTGWINLSEILAGGLLNTRKPCKYQL
jgi:hypothetical protein